jgi:hypothetical protein
MSQCQKKSRNPIATQKRFMTTEVMSRIWSNRVDYSLSVGLSHWKDSAYLLPVIVYMYKSHNLFYTTIVECIQNILMAAGALIPLSIVMMIHNAV